MERATLKAQLDKWITNGVAEASRAWVACNPHFVGKKDGSVRTVIDYRPFNDVIEPWDWPLPKIRDIRHQLAGSSWYCRLDLKDAFHRVGVDPASRPLTAFWTPWGVYQFKRMPFGLSTAPATYQRFLDWILQPVKQLLVNYVDDILLYSATLPRLRALRRRVLRLLASSNVEVNWKKSVMESREVDFVGLSIRGGEIGAALPVRPFTTPHTKAEWQSALGFANCYRDYIPMYSSLTERLYPGSNQVDEATRQTRWGELWTQLHHAMTLSQFSYDQPSSLFLDASQYAVGGVLLQGGKVCGLFSKGLTGPQSRYSATDREHLALMLGVEAFRVFLQSNQQVTVNTDHTALLNRDEGALTHRQFRWKTRILAITTNIRYVPGRDNPADYWSRAGWKSGGDKIYLYKASTSPSI